MPNSVTITSTFGLKCLEQLDQPGAAEANSRITFDAFNKLETRNGSSIPPAQRWAAFVVTLSAGAATIDLTALVTTNGAIFDATDYRLLELLVLNENANAVTITKGASNGYQASGFPFPDDGIKVAPKGSNSNGGRLHLYFGSSCPLVSGTVKTLDLAGTGTDQFQFALLLGDNS